MTLSWEEQVLATLEVVRPVLQADGGELSVVKLDPQNHLVVLELQGACRSCPVSSQTVHGGIERILQSRVDSEITVEVHEDDLGV